MISNNALTRAALVLTLVGCGDSAGDHAGGGGDDGAGAGWPEQPETFRIELSGGPCFGSCPTYDAAIDQDGNVRFVGEVCSARPGVFEHKVAPAEARALYEAIAASPYPSLRDRYVDDDDGCSVSTDSPTFEWNVALDGQAKPLVRYGGCDGIPALEEVDALMPLVFEHAELRHLLEPNPSYCDSEQSILYSVNLRLARAGAAFGVLRIESENAYSGSFVLESCDGSRLAAGALAADARRWLLLDGTREPIDLPELGAVGSLIVDFAEMRTFNQPAKMLGVRALREREDIAFDFSEAAQCDP